MKMHLCCWIPVIRHSISSASPMKIWMNQSIGHNIRSRIEFFRSRYQFLRKWHSSVYYYLARGIIILRLIIDWLLSFTVMAATLGLVKKLRQKLTVYSQLILWHIKKYNRWQQQNRLINLLTAQYAFRNNIKPLSDYIFYLCNREGGAVRNVRTFFQLSKGLKLS